ncbi:MAG: FG-GAP-like repeat-containing protein [Deltaproteobacteria bacterium]|nr:FG-GAP-like repeat-containing protein [Deltaproteobacteria bacterium]
MMKTKTLVCALAFFALFALFFLTPATGVEEKPQKLAILPFTMNSDRDLNFLREGIMDMLSSRLAWKDKLEIIEKGVVKKEFAAVPGPMNEAKALTIGKALGADFVIFGSLTVFGESVSLDAKILDVKKSEVLVTAYDQSQGMDGVIPTVNQFAENINAKIMGKDIPYKEQRPGEVAQQKEGALVNVGKDSTGSYKKPSLVQRFKIEIRGLDVGDLDGDGKNELVLIDKTSVFVYKWDKKSPYLFKTVEGSWSPNYIYVTVADLDGNGKAEIYICNLTATDAGSLVLEWDGAKFKEVIRGQTWLIRVVDLPGKGKVLLGQRRDPEGNYLGDVHLLKRQGNGFASMGALNLPRFSNVFNFIQCDLSGDGSVFTIQLGPWEHLQVYNATGEKLWKSDDYFGGSLCYMDYSDPNENRMVHTAKRLFIASPIFAYDVNGDGKKSVVICQNHSKVGRIFGDFRWFGSGRVLFMDWDEAGLVSQLTSQKLSGTVVGYQVVDVDNDGLKELVVANVTSESYFIGLPKSRLVVYDME